MVHNVCRVECVATSRRWSLLNGSMPFLRQQNLAQVTRRLLIPQRQVKRCRTPGSQGGNGAAPVHCPTFERLHEGAPDTLSARPRLHQGLLNPGHGTVRVERAVAEPEQVAEDLVAVGGH